MTVDLNAAATFLHANARVLERRRFDHLLRRRPEGARPATPCAPTATTTAASATRSSPTCARPPASPSAIHTVMEILHEIGAHDDPMIGPAADWLATITREDGGIPFVLEDAMAHPHAPWWQHSDESSVTQTAANAAALHNLSVSHPWLEKADEFLFARIAELDASRLGEDVGLGYDLLFCVHFLDAHPDDARATAALEALGPIPAAEPGSELPSALDLSPVPGRAAAACSTCERDLDALEAAQQDDGGWTVSWPDWNAAAAIEWRGVATVNALKPCARTAGSS